MTNLVCMVMRFFDELAFMGIRGFILKGLSNQQCAFMNGKQALILSSVCPHLTVQVSDFCPQRFLVEL